MTREALLKDGYFYPKKFDDLIKVYLYLGYTVLFRRKIVNWDIIVKVQIGSENTTSPKIGKCLTLLLPYAKYQFGALRSNMVWWTSQLIESYCIDKSDVEEFLNYIKNG